MDDNETFKDEYLRSKCRFFQFKWI